MVTEVDVVTTMFSGPVGGLIITKSCAKLPLTLALLTCSAP